MKKHTILHRVLIVFFVILIVCAGVFFGYTAVYYHAQDIDLTTMDQADPLIEITGTDSRYLSFGNGSETKAFIFYPGAKVEYTAYAPLMQACADNGIRCILVRMPFNLAILNTNAADAIVAQYPEIQEWYIGGHSLGGAMAAVHAAKKPDVYEGVILLGSYSTADLSKTRVISIYGSEDTVLSRDKYEKYRSNLPADLTEVVIEGGCHSYVGSYGLQKNDGTPSITREEQTRITAEVITAFVMP